MRTLLVICLAAAAIPVRPERAPHPTPPSANPLIGVWKLVNVSVAGVGDMIQAMDDTVLHITSDQMLVFEKGIAKPNDGSTYTVDWSKQPVAVNLVPKNEKPIQGILKIEGNQLTLCLALDGKRPASFTTDSNKIAVMRLTRIR